MRKCPYCNIEVGGNLKKCPFCQSRLSGEGENTYFPPQIALRIGSFFYKLQLFIVWALIILSLGLDFLFGIKPLRLIGLGTEDFRWSLLVVMWLAVFEFWIIRLFHRGLSSSRILTIIVFVVLVMLMITAYYLGFFAIMVNWIVPVTLMATMLANFILAMIDNDGNSMIYLLSNLFVGITPYIVFYILKRDCPVAWIVCLLAGVIVFVGAIIFKGREVISEIQRRLNM